VGREVRLGILQFGSTRDKGKNVEKLRSLTSRCEADLIIMPEYAMAPITGLSPRELREVAEPVDGSFIQGIEGIAKECSSYIVVGMLELADAGVYNTAVLISPKGGVIARYRKVHLFDAYGYRESEYFLAGNSPSPVVDIGKAKVAMAICFDIRFPELFRGYALSGAEIVAVPMGWYRGPLKEETLLFLARARAHENTLYLGVSSQYSPEFVGRSMVVDPLGVVIADLGIGEKYLEVSIDIDLVYRARKILPVLKLRRADVYSRL